MSNTSMLEEVLSVCDKEFNRLAESWVTEGLAADVKEARQRIDHLLCVYNNAAMRSLFVNEETKLLPCM